MATVYLIGGAPRAGKTTLLQKFLEHKPMRSLSTDALRGVLQQVIKPEEEPDLFAPSAFIGADIKTRHDIHIRPNKVVEKQNKESAIVWRSVVPYIESVLSDGADIVVEGVAVLPELVAASSFSNYRSVFIGNSSEEHVNEILSTAQQNEYDWLHNVPEEVVKSFGLFSQLFSAYVQAEAQKYDMPYIEMSKSSFEQSIARAVDVLLGR